MLSAEPPPRPPALSAWVGAHLDSPPKAETAKFLVGVGRQQPLQLLAQDSKYSWSDEGC